jgi:hypothetical protein
MMHKESLTAEEVTELRRLMDIEQIRRKKHLLSHLLDNLQLERWAELYAEDAVAQWGQLGEWVGRERIYNGVKSSVANRTPYYAMHLTTNMAIELTGPVTATSCSYLVDFNNDLNPRINPIKLLGVHEESWEKVSGDWQIKRQRFQILWPERSDNPNLHDSGAQR